MNPARWRIIKEVAADAMERPRAERKTYLAKACADDVELRAQVDRLLSEHERPLDFFRIPPAQGSAAQPSIATQDGAGVSSAAPSTLLRKERASDRDTGSYKYLPPEFQEQSIRRLGYLALVYAAAYALNYVIRELVAHGMSDVPFVASQHGASATVASSLILASLGLYVFVRRGAVGAGRLTRVAVAFQIVGAFGIALGQFSALRAGWDATSTGVSWACVWIVVFPFMVPLPPRIATVAAVCAALMDGVGIAIWVAAGTLQAPPVNAFVAALVPNLVCAGIAAIVARIVYRWGAELGKAQRLGSYRLESLLGRGGMGEVWIARHHMLARPAALKLIRPRFLSADADGVEALQRFEREAQSTAALTSPHTIKLFDFGTTLDGIFYYAMELLDGFDLDTLVRRFGPVPPERVVHFLLQACDSLAEAHEAGLVHRDIKPANIYAGRQGLRWDFIKVLDFGLVGSRKQTHDERDTAQQPRIIGTPAYMAPEAVRGGEPDPRSDLYALGCVGYWLLTGRPVFEGDGPMDLAIAHVSQQPDPPSQRSELDVPAALDEVLLWCLHKDGTQRPSSADELAARLRAVEFTRPWTQERARAWWARHHGALT